MVVVLTPESKSWRNRVDGKRKPLGRSRVVKFEQTLRAIRNAGIDKRPNNLAQQFRTKADGAVVAASTGCAQLIKVLAG